MKIIRGVNHGRKGNGRKCSNEESETLRHTPEYWDNGKAASSSRVDTAGHVTVDLGGFQGGQELDTSVRQ